MAEITELPTRSVLVSNVATPSMSGVVCTGLPFTKNATVPVGGVLGGTPATVAVNVTAPPNVLGFAELVTVVAEARMLTDTGPANADGPPAFVAYTR